MRIWQEHTQAFTEFCATYPSASADLQPTAQQPLLGMTVGVKDVIDVAELPTRNGSKTCQLAKPAVVDAPVVAAVRAAGAVIVGKTATTEFAFTDPTDCRSPHDIKRSPGGSSSGSGAAVGAGMVDMALGTQTAGSLIRPAAYCGAVGFKPSYRALPTAGVTPLAPSFDTVGLITISVDIATSGFAALRAHGSSDCNTNDISFVSAILPSCDPVHPDWLDGHYEAVEGISYSGFDVKNVALPFDLDEVVSNHRVVMNCEAFHAHGHLLGPSTYDLLQPNFRAGLTVGASVTDAQYETSKDRLTQTRAAFWHDLAHVDVVVTLPVPEGAPLIDGTTGFQDWLTPWTVFGGPLISIPWGMDRLRRPRAVMLAAHPGQDLILLEVAARLEKLAPPLPRPIPSSR